MELLFSCQVIRQKTPMHELQTQPQSNGLAVSRRTSLDHQHVGKATQDATLGPKTHWGHFNEKK